MGDPRRLKKKFKGPNKLWDKTRLEEELLLLGEYGLRNKREIWRHKTFLSKIRQQGRDIQAAPVEVQRDAIEKLIGRLQRLGIIQPGQETIDDVLDLNLKDICERRLQTFVFKKGLANTPSQARQLIVHKHIAINNQVFNSPGHLVLKSEEDLIAYAPTSPLNNADHPIRQQAQYATTEEPEAIEDE
ncbi:MAG: 30S ribosomal protein S4 [Candidatus Hodarchaeota archaeon]